MEKNSDEPLGDPIVSFNDEEFEISSKRLRKIIFPIMLIIWIILFIPETFKSSEIMHTMIIIIGYIITALTLVFGWYIFPRTRKVTLFRNGIVIHGKSLKLNFLHPEFFHNFENVQSCSNTSKGELKFSTQFSKFILYPSPHNEIIIQTFNDYKANKSIMKSE